MKKLLFLIIPVFLFACKKEQPGPTSPVTDTTNTLNLGLVAYYPFSGNANDASGNNHHGTVMGATLTTDRSGKANNAYSFSAAATAYIAIPDAGDLRLDDTDYTIALWVKETSRINQASLISKRGSGQNNGYILYVQGGSQPSPGTITYTISAGLDPIMYSNTLLQENIWKHIALTYNYSTNTTRIYINGALDATSTSLPSPNVTNNSPLYIGADPALMSYYFNGSIDEVRIYHRVLGTSEISTLAGQ